MVHFLICYGCDWLLLLQIDQSHDSCVSLEYAQSTWPFLVMISSQDPARITKYWFITSYVHILLEYPKLENYQNIPERACFAYLAKCVYMNVATNVLL